MPLNLKWVGEADYDRVLQTRLYCYGASWKDQSLFRARLEHDTRCKPGDYLLAERDGLDVGTLTSLSLKMWLHGASFACQGVAWVGTIKSHRRGGSGNEKGIATQVMNEGLRLARERGEAISALMPFRATFYEHFGYGFAERRTEWTLPANVCPAGNFDSLRFMTESDHAAMAECRNRVARAGNADMERSADGWNRHFKTYADAMFIVDRPTKDGPVHGWLAIVAESRDGKSAALVVDREHDSIDALKRQLRFLASLKDQHSVASIHLPGDIPLHLILRETQLPHRLVEHAVAAARPYTRMQIRVLDHKKVLERIHWPMETKGKFGVSIKECEGEISRLTIDINNGRATVSAGSTDDVQLSDVHWAEIISGYISATELAKLGLIKSNKPQALKILDSLSTGSAPFCMEYF